jgi:uncharacterized membrane protein YfcA
VDIDWILATVALGVGLLVGLTGVGAGAIMTPVLVGFFGVSLPVAIATDLIFATLTKMAGVPFHHRNGSINWPVTKRLWLGSIPGTIIGVIVVVLFASRGDTKWLMWPLVAIVFFTAVTLALRAIRPHGDPNTSEPHRELHPALAPTGGFGIGSAVALTSVGAGALGMALLVRLAPPGVKPRELVGTDLVHAIPIALLAGAAYGAAGLVSMSLLITLLIGSLPGVVLGSLWSARAPSRFLYALLALVLLTAVVFLVLK